MKVLLVDNFDSFTFNLSHYIQRLGFDVSVVRSDELDIQKVDFFDKIILSPGPGLPNDFPGMIEVIDKFHNTKPILGVCLGMQAICSSFGCDIYNLKKVYHGVQERIQIDSNDKLYNGIERSIDVALYHSWAVKIDSSQWFVTGVSNYGVVMSVKHKVYDLYGVQYHPESIMTTNGLKLISNFLSI
ncbi:MAG: anthranilate synthase component II [Crocinitomicaceae bacterium]